ncbi:hypothetical protein [Parasitella parasitica]|uniref:Uncharacterized protein n=1 Tax=Parasitella parasitica TaxID=35722 RepID=A0A0B7NFV1_9FUNG|nr:hypothetical protein [Parasitella parasitica]
MESNQHPSMAFISDTRGISYTIDKTTNTMENKNNQIECDRTVSCQRSSTEVSSSRNHGSFSDTKHRFSIQFLLNTRGDKTTTHFGLLSNQQIYSMSTFQDGRSSSIEGYYREKRLYLQIGSQRCIRSDTYSHRLKKIFDILKPRDCLPVQDTSLWDECQPSSIQQIDAFCDGIYQETRNSLSLLLGRHLYSGLNERRNSSTYHHGNESFGEFGFFDQSRKKRSNSIPTTGVSGILVQHENHEDFSPNQKDQQITKQDQTSFEHQKLIQLPVVCSTTRKNDQHDTCGGRGTATHQTHATGSSNQSSTSSTKLGCSNDSITEQYSRIELVEDMDYQEEWTPDSEDYKMVNFTTDCARRRIRPRMGRQFFGIKSDGTLDFKGKKPVYKCKRANSNILRIKTTREKISKFQNQDIYRQRHSSKIQHKIWWYGITNPSRLSGEYSGNQQSIPVRCRIPTYSWKRKHTGRLVKSTTTRPLTTLQSSSSSANFSPNESNLGAVQNRRICEQNHHTVNEILESTAGSRSRSNGCVPTTIAEERFISVPSMETDSSSNTTIKTSTNQTSSADNTTLADTILVSDIDKNEPDHTTDNFHLENMEDDRMELIRNKRKVLNFSDEDINFLMQTQRTHTHTVYNNGWRRWATWCKQQKPPLNPLDYEARQVL